MNRILLLIVVIAIQLFGWASCKNTNDCCVLVDTDVQIHYINQQGENLINSSDEFDESKIKVYFKNGTEYEYIYQGNLDNPNMHFINTDSNGNVILTVFPSNYYVDDRSTTLIELNKNITDTLVCEFHLSGNNVICKNAWLNGIEMNNRFLEIEK